MTLVQQKTANVLSLQNLKLRSEGVPLTMKDLRSLTVDTLVTTEPDVHRAMAPGTTLEVIDGTRRADLEGREDTHQVDAAEPGIESPEVDLGSGRILALTIHLETGPIERFCSPGNYASYCRCVKGTRLSNGKVKGKGNHKCGNQYPRGPDPRRHTLPSCTTRKPGASTIGS